MWLMCLACRWLSIDQNTAVQVDALWALTNIASGPAEHVAVLIKHNAVHALISLLKKPPAAKANSNSNAVIAAADSAGVTKTQKQQAETDPHRLLRDSAGMYVSTCHTTLQ